MSNAENLKARIDRIEAEVAERKAKGLDVRVMEIGVRKLRRQYAAAVSIEAARDQVTGPRMNLEDITKHEAAYQDNLAAIHEAVARAHGIVEEAETASSVAAARGHEQAFVSAEDSARARISSFTESANRLENVYAREASLVSRDPGKYISNLRRATEEQVSAAHKRLDDYHQRIAATIHEKALPAVTTPAPSKPSILGRVFGTPASKSGDTPSRATPTQKHVRIDMEELSPRSSESSAYSSTEEEQEPPPSPPHYSIATPEIIANSIPLPADPATRPVTPVELREGDPGFRVESATYTPIKSAPTNVSAGASSSGRAGELANQALVDLSQGISLADQAKLSPDEYERILRETRHALRQDAVGREDKDRIRQHLSLFEQAAQDLASRESASARGGNVVNVNGTGGAASGGSGGAARSYNTGSSTSPLSGLGKPSFTIGNHLIEGLVFGLIGFGIGFGVGEAADDEIVNFLEQSRVWVVLTGAFVGMGVGMMCADFLGLSDLIVKNVV